MSHILIQPSFGLPAGRFGSTLTRPALRTVSPRPECRIHCGISAALHINSDIILDRSSLCGKRIVRPQWWNNHMKCQLLWWKDSVIMFPICIWKEVKRIRSLTENANEALFEPNDKNVIWEWNGAVTYILYCFHFLEGNFFKLVFLPNPVSAAGSRAVCWRCCRWTSRWTS